MRNTIAEKFFKNSKTSNNLGVSFESSHKLLWKVKRDIYLRNRPTLKLKYNANRNLFLRKMLLVGHEKVTKIEPPDQLPESAFRVNSSGNIALTYARMWSKESDSSGRVSNWFFQFIFQVVFDSNWKPILRLQLSSASTGCRSFRAWRPLLRTVYASYRHCFFDRTRMSKWSTDHRVIWKKSRHLNIDCFQSWRGVRKWSFSCF